MSLDFTRIKRTFHSANVGEMIRKFGMRVTKAQDYDLLFDLDLKRILSPMRISTDLKFSVMRYDPAFVVPSVSFNPLFSTTGFAGFEYRSNLAMSATL